MPDPKTSTRPIGRRGFLTAAGGVALSATLAGCSGGGDGGDSDGDSDGGDGGGDNGGGGNGGYEYLDEEPDYGDWFADTDLYEGTVDWTGESAVSVDVGAGSNGYQFGPPAIAVDSGTTVTWEWTGEGQAHNVVAEDGPFDSGDPQAGDDVTFEYTFESTGTYRYICVPHQTTGMVGAVHVV
ncbi:hypothetical protein GCM10028857_12550 [Salinarchaeum chitinilyticum]